MILIAVAAVFLCGTSAGAGWADKTPDCEGGARKITNFGLWDLDGKMNIGVWGRSEHAMRVVRFLSEPEVGAVDPDGPCYGKVEEGDVIVAIGGELVTTEAAGFLFMTAPAGLPIDLTLRRTGVERTVTVVPTEICENDPRSFMNHLLKPLERTYIIRGTPEVQMKPAPPASPPTPPAPVEPPRSVDFPHPWMGIGLRLSAEGHRADGNLRFSEPPTIFRIEPGSNAEKAGLRPGDVITEIDGILIDTVEGTESFMGIQPDQKIEWTILRDGRPRTIEMVAKPIPHWLERLATTYGGSAAGEPPAEELRYSGALENTAIQVVGSAPVNVTVNYMLGLVTIRTPDTTIRLRTVKKGDEK
jgi:hypothetical protein